jgi:myosin heavy subunit
VEEDDDDDDDDLNDDQADDPSQSCIHTFGKLYDKLGFDPHVYETSCMAYRNLATTQTNQTILVSGESGAGKTETVKIVMSHLATLEQSRPGGPVYTSHDNTLSAVETVKRVLESSPVFEAFGNAKTLRNDNSSRFGKFTQLQFDVESMEHAQQDNRLIPSCSLAGSFCVTYLLEKSRVVSHSKGERTYHIFYQLLEAPAQFKQTVWEDLVDATTDDFNYLGATDTHAIDGVSDKDQWPRTLNALKVFDVKGESLTTLLRALCIVLQLGNLTFDRDPTSADHEEGGTVISSPDELDKLSELMGIDSKVLESEMTLRLIKTGYDEVHVQLRPSVAKESCDALAKEIYARVFDYLVRKVNAYTRAEAHFDPKHSDTFGMISLLDIFGFERFKVNRFEQLCINYCNEALQHKYVLDNFRKVQEEYEAEGIEIFDFSVVDNSPVLNLLQGRLGLIMSLNEECVRPNGNDESYVYKIKTLHKDHVRLIDEKLHRRTEFGVKHFAGPVTYDSTKFVERNTDKLPDGLMYCAARSTNSLIREEFETLVKSHEENETSGVRRKKATNRTVLEKFRSHLRDLMASMEDTETRYIRCIKPNETMTPRMTQHDTTMRQLECAGLVTAIAISRESFPNRLGYEPIIERFGCLMSQSDAKKMSSMVKKLAVDYMLKQLLASMAEKQRNGTLVMPFQCGNTRVYFRAGALEHLETKRLGYYTKRVVTIQRCVRKIQGQAAYARTRESIIKAQTAVRAMLAYKQLQRQKSAAVMLQCWARMLQAASMLIRLKCNHAATVIQSSWRATSRLGQMHKYRKAVVVIQKAVRNRKNKTSFTTKLARTVEMARMDHRVKGLQRKVSGRGSFLPQSTTGRKVDASLLEEIET